MISNIDVSACYFPGFRRTKRNMISMMQHKFNIMSCIFIFNVSFGFTVSFKSSNKLYHFISFISSRCSSSSASGCCAALVSSSVPYSVCLAIFSGSPPPHPFFSPSSRLRTVCFNLHRAPFSFHAIQGVPSSRFAFLVSHRCTAAMYAAGIL